MGEFKGFCNLNIMYFYRVTPLKEVDLQAGIALTSAVTTQFTPKLDKAPRIIPQGKARN